MGVVLQVAATSSAPALVLCPWRETDVAALVAAWRDPALRRWSNAPVYDDAEAMRWLRAQQAGWAAGQRYGFAVDAADGHLVGNVVLKDVASGNASAEVGYWTAAYARGMGVAPRALDVLTAWAFATFGVHGLNRLELLHQVDNLASCRVAGKSR
ncbi:GNAT family N-acetyltransferase [Streptosporangium album]|nr:GNAT family N-acetyltransferase [Streptosporangium album]